MISIVMAYYNRLGLLRHTLKTFTESQEKDFEVIIVDDFSSADHNIDNINAEFPSLNIKVINMAKRGTKTWFNPCVPYNVGFRVSSGDKIIIQNPECYHYDDILSYTLSNLTKNDYFSFGCYSLSREKTENLNETLKTEFIINKSVSEDIVGDEGWYNHSIHRPVGYHFCSAIYKNQLDELGGFDERYAYGISWDDNEILERIKRKGLNVNILDNKIVLHQWHGTVNYNLPNHIELGKINKELFENITMKENLYKVNDIKVVSDSIEDTDYILHEWIRESTKNSKVVVELGAGFFNRLAEVNKNVKKKIGIEIWSSYIENSKYNDCIKIQGDVFDFENLIDEGDFDTAMIVDVLEHFSKSDSINLIKSLKNKFKKIILMIPEGNYPQEVDVTGHGAHYYQTHRSTWYASEIKNLLGFDDVVLYENFHSQHDGGDSGCLFATWTKEEDSNELKDKKILIVGGTGALGQTLIKKYQTKNHILVFSRDEHKQVSLSKEDWINKSNVDFCIGDIKDISSIRNCIEYYKPHVIINTAALKHVPICESNPFESVNVNIIGHQNLIQSIKWSTHKIETLIFVSTDKACKPINVYGMCKAISERIYIEYAKQQSDVKVCLVRYGNVLESTGSVIPFFKKLIEDGKKTLPITDMRMTRFLLTLDRAVDLIDWVYRNDNSHGNIAVPKVESFSIPSIAKALFMCKNIYDGEIEVVGIRPGEKLHEEMISDIEWMRTIETNDNFLITDNIIKDEYKSYNSFDSLMDDSKVYDFLKINNII